MWELSVKLERILYVDDDPDDRDLFCSALLHLRGDGLCSEAGSAQDCIHQLNEATGLPEVIITDINMPIMSGIELLKYLKSQDRFKHIPVVLFSTATNPDANKFFEMGAHSYFIKPQFFQNYKNIIVTIFNDILGEDA